MFTLDIPYKCYDEPIKVYLEITSLKLMDISLHIIGWTPILSLIRSVFLDCIESGQGNDVAY